MSESCVKLLESLAEEALQTGQRLGLNFCIVSSDGALVFLARSVRAATVRKISSFANFCRSGAKLLVLCFPSCKLQKNLVGNRVARTRSLPEEVVGSEDIAKGLVQSRRVECGLELYIDWSKSI